MDTASGLKGIKFNVSRTRKCLSRKKSKKTPETVLALIKIFSNQIRKAYLLMIFDEIDICYGAANKVVKQDLKNGKIWTTLLQLEVGYYYKTFKDPFYNKDLPFFDFLRLSNL